MAKVSIIIPTYNYGKFICEAIDSILNQTFKDYEIIIVDDGSTDNTEEIIKKYEDKINYFYKTNNGPASARNLGIQNATGDYICFLDSDDIFLPNKLEIQVNLLRSPSSSKTALLYSDFLITDKNLNFILKYYSCKKFKSHDDAMKYLLQYNYINTSTVMIVKDYLLEVGLFNEKYTYLEDYDLWLRLGSSYEFGYTNLALVKTRSHSANYRKKINPLDKMSCLNDIKRNIKKE